MSALLVAAGGLVMVGVLVVFAGARPAPRGRGLALMAVGAVTALAAARPAAATTWWMILAAALSLAAMVTAASVLLRRLQHVDAEADLDDEPW